ncbi:DMT family transporter [Marinospirillum perlucidum]|uniref:DMT family transporter n=1 Tax=Marinospirillum perlucidum TaxID=1982602 RepID=UPI000DF19A3F|nr:DMT family transporter [Marinospirillum perlucidum]
MTTTSKHQHLQADLLLLLTTLIAAAGWIFSKETLAGMQPLQFIALRFAGAGLVLACFCLLPLKQLTWPQFRAAAKVGCVFGLAMIFWILGLKHAQHLGVGAFLATLGIVMLPFLNRLFGGEAPPTFSYLALPLVISGLALLSLDPSFHLGWGEFSFMLAAFFLALMFLFNSQATARLAPLPLTSIQLLITGLITGSISLLSEPLTLNSSPVIWGWFAASLLLATSLRFLLQTWAQSLAPPSHTAIIMTLEPVWTALAASLWFAETMTSYQLLGCLLIFSAILINRWPAFRQGWLQRKKALEISD